MVHRTIPFLRMEEVRYQPIQEVWRGLRDGLREAGLDGSLLLLNSALATALSEERVAERYLGGEDIFAGDRLDSGDS